MNVKQKFFVYNLLIITLTYSLHADNNNTFPANKTFIKPDVSFIIADMKYSEDGTLKILEFGEGERSYFKGHEQLYGDGKIWKGLWNKLEQYKLPIWYVGNFPSNKKKLQERLKEIAYKKLTSIGGKCVRDVHQLSNDEIFKQQKQKDIKNKNNIADYQGIIVFCKYRKTDGFKERFKRRHPGFIYLDDVAKNYCRNKHKTSQLFNDEELKKFRPHCGLFNKIYTPELVQEILETIKAETAVIKPLTLANGWGVIIVDKKNLDQTLKKIINNKQSLASYSDMSYRKWANDKHSNFLVESYEPSKIITVNNRKYDATMRAVCLLEHNNNEVDVSFLGSYWKLPSKSIDERGTLTELHKSKVNKSRQSSAKVSPEDEKNVFDILRYVMPRAYINMLE